MDSICILGIDPGLRSYGYSICTLSNNKLDIILAGDVDNNKSLCSMFYNLKDLICTYKPDHIVLEKIFLNTNAKTSFYLNSGRTIPLLLAEMYNVPLTEYAPTTVKKNILGNGHGEKALIQEYICNNFHINITNNGADAIAMCINFSLDMMNNNLQQ